jgi:phage terminase small subunit
MVLSNHKHELFAQAISKGKSQREAYLGAGYSVRPEIADVNASRLLTVAKVANRVTELQERAAIKCGITIGDIIRQLAEDRSLAHGAEQAGAAVSASLGQAKVLGFLKDKIEHSGPDGGPIEHRAAAQSEVDELFGPTPHLIEQAHG